MKMFVCCNWFPAIPSSFRQFFLLLSADLKASNQVDLEAGHQIEHDNSNINDTYTVEEFKVGIMEPESSGGPCQMNGAIYMQTSEYAFTVQVVTLCVEPFHEYKLRC